jgi:hypothetical protein
VSPPPLAKALKLSTFLCFDIFPLLKISKFSAYGELFFVAIAIVETCDLTE